MTTVNIKGPTSPALGAVSYHKHYRRTRRGVEQKMMVTFNLPGRLSLLEHRDAPPTPPADNALIADNLAPSDNFLDDSDNEPIRFRQRRQPIFQSKLEDSLRKSAGQSSEIEVIDIDSASDSDNGLDPDLFSIDEELNTALTAPTQDSVSGDVKVKTEGQGQKLDMSAVIKSIYRSFPVRDTPPPPGYRYIPPNLVNTIQRELNFYLDGADEDVEVMGKVVFTLKDPISARKIKLPVKATTCRHFECFDLDTFCMYSQIPQGVKGAVRKRLTQHSLDSRRLERLFVEQQQNIAQGLLSARAPGLVQPQFSEHGQMFFGEVSPKAPPLYKCPLCDERFGLRQLYISDVFNFFVKTTPEHTTRIELVENERYKIVEDEDEEDGVVVLSDDEDGEASKGPESDFGAGDFDDGLDDVLQHIEGTRGTWNDPLTLD